MMKACSVPGCANSHYAKGLCAKHYARKLRTGSEYTCTVETHGKSKTPIYKIWSGIKVRCFHLKSKAYPYYGGRGITMCDRWKNSFNAFELDVGPRPSPRHQLDRIDNNGNYEPGNVRWAEPKTNARNKRGVKLTEADVLAIRTSTEPYKQIGERYGISEKYVSSIRCNERWN